MHLEIFKEDNGNFSMTRVVCFLSFITAIMLSFIAFFKVEISATQVEIIFGFLTAGTAVKTIQKPFER